MLAWNILHAQRVPHHSWPTTVWTMNTGSWPHRWDALQPFPAAAEAAAEAAVAEEPAPEPGFLTRRCATLCACGLSVVGRAHGAKTRVTSPACASHGSDLRWTLFTCMCLAQCLSLVCRGCGCYQSLLVPDRGPFPCSLRSLIVSGAEEFIYNRTWILELWTPRQRSPQESLAGHAELRANCRSTLPGTGCTTCWVCCYRAVTAHLVCPDGAC